MLYHAPEPSANSRLLGAWLHDYRLPSMTIDAHLQGHLAAAGFAQLQSLRMELLLLLTLLLRTLAFQAEAMGRPPSNLHPYGHCLPAAKQAAASSRDCACLMLYSTQAQTFVHATCSSQPT